MYMEFSEPDWNEYELLQEAMARAACAAFDAPVERREPTEEDWDIPF